MSAKWLDGLTRSGLTLGTPLHAAIGAVLPLPRFLSRIAARAAGRLPASVTRLLNEPLVRSLASGAMQSMAILGAGAVLSLTSSILLGRLLGPENFSVYAVALSWVTLASGFLNFGLPQTQLRFTAAYVETQDWPKLAGLMRWTRRWSFVASALSIGAAGTAAWLGWPSAELSAVMLLCGVLTAMMVHLDITSATLRALGRIAWAMLPDNFFRHLVFIGGLGFLWFGAPALMGPEAALGVTLAANGVAIGLVMYFLSREKRLKLTETPASEATAWWRLSLTMVAFNGLAVVSSQVSILAASWYLDPAETGAFAAARRMSDVILFGLLAFGRIYSPMVSSLYAKGDGSGLAKSAVFATLWSFSIAVVIAAPMVAFPSLVLGLYGDGFTRAAAVLQILAVAQIVPTLGGPAGIVMNMTGREIQGLMLSIFGLTLNVMAILVFAPMWGGEGIAIAGLIVRAIMVVLTVSYVLIRMGIGRRIAGWVRRGGRSSASDG